MNKVNVAGRKFEKVSDFEDLTNEQIEYLINEWSPTLNLAVQAYNQRASVDGKASYLCCEKGNSTPTTPKERVEIELQELNAKTINLHEFCDSEIFHNKLCSEAQFLLVTQLKTMQAYSNILTRRLEIWRD